MRSESTSATSAVAPFIVAASGCAPPMPPRPAVTTSRPSRWSCPNSLRAAAAKVSNVPWTIPWRADVDPRARRHLAEHRQAEPLEAAELRAPSPRPERGANWR